MPRAQDIARGLRDAIHEGRLKAGQPVRQEAVAEEYGVSRIPVREALRQLEVEGLVVIRPHSGARVASLDYAECEEIYKMRERLEPLALVESMAHITDEQVAEAVRLAEQLASLPNDPPAAWLKADRELHLACYAGVTTPRLLRTIVGFWNTTQQYRRILLTTFSERDFALQEAEHLLIVDALASRNVRTGEDVMRAHIDRSRLRLARHRELFD
ncbi:MAG TPA: GntR family transcriptional regulator [Conexibacter sp.]|nr:GntR family transcriptional regulator [Conexibacter sp.]